MEDKNTLKKTKNIFKSLKTDPNSILFAEEKIDNRLLKEFKKSKYEKDSLLLKLIQLTGSNFNDKEKTQTRVNYVEEREIDRSTLYSFDGPTQLIHNDLGNLELLGKNSTVPKYVLLLVDLFSSKVYVYPMCIRKPILQKMKLLYNEVTSQ